MPNILKNIFSAGASKLVDSVATGLDNLLTNKEEKEAAKLAITQEINRHFEAIMSDATKQIELENADRDSARDMNAKVQESDKASWLSKNTAYILDFIFVFAFLWLLYLIFEKIVPESNKEIFYMAFGSLGTIVVTIVSFHRGTSKGSEEKQKSLDRISRNKQNL